MTIHDPDKIDAIGLEGNSTAVLTISDHLDWDDENSHLEVLQEKINKIGRAHV